jgi:hypothetical protein
VLRNVAVLLERLTHVTGVLRNVAVLLEYLTHVTGVT